MRITIQHDASSDRLLTVTDAGGAVTQIPPGKGRVIEGAAPFALTATEKFLGWTWWNATQPGAPFSARMPFLLRHRERLLADGDKAGAEKIAAEFKANGHTIEDFPDGTSIAAPILPVVAGKSS